MIGSFDDGMQFAEPVEPAKGLRYRVIATMEYGRKSRAPMYMTGDMVDLEEARKALAEYAAIRVPERFRSSTNVEFVYGGLFIEVVEPDGTSYPFVEEPEQVEEVQKSSEVVESQEEAAQASSTDEQPAVATSGDYEVFVLCAGKPEYVLYRGNSPQEAEAAVASMIRQCVRVWTKFKGHMVAYDGLHGNDRYWDAHEQYVKDWNAGAFNEAFLRDALNEEAIRPEYVRQHEAGYIGRSN